MGENKSEICRWAGSRSLLLSFKHHFIVFWTWQWGMNVTTTWRHFQNDKYWLMLTAKQCDNSFKLGKSTEATWQLVRCPLCAESDQIPQCTTAASTYEIKLKPNNLDVICDSFAWRQSTRAETFSSQLPSLYCLASVGPEPPTPPSDQHHVTAKAENVPSYPMCCQFEWQDGDRLSHVCSFKQIT